MSAGKQEMDDFYTTFREKKENRDDVYSVKLKYNLKLM